MYETKYNVMIMFHKIQEYEKLEIKVCPDLSQLISDHALSISILNPKTDQICQFLLFSSPEHEVLMVSYCDQSLSVVRALSTFCFKGLLLQNGWTDFEIILLEGCLGDPLPKLLKPFHSIEQDGRQSKKIEKPLNDFFC